MFGIFLLLCYNNLLEYVSIQVYLCYGINKYFFRSFFFNTYNFLIAGVNGSVRIISELKITGFRNLPFDKSVCVAI